MKTDVITVSSKGKRMEEALEQADRVAVYEQLNHKNALQLRLLTEEMLSLMRSLTGETEGLFWIEVDDGEYCLHLQVATRLTSEKREELLSLSSTGKNESARGLIGRLRDFFDWGSDADVAAYSGSLLMPEMFEHTTSPALDWEWSMTRYEEALSGRIQQNVPGAQEEWDELEKSVVKHVADDVRVSIRNGVVELIILKKIG